MPRKVDRDTWPSFLAKAVEFLGAARQSHVAKHWNACVSAAVHAGILACDTITVGRTGARNAGAHEEIVPLLKTALADEAKEAAAQQRRIERLLSAKNLAEYEGRSLGARDAATAVIDAERLVEFAQTQSRRF